MSNGKENYGLKLDDVLDAATRYMEQWHVMKKNPVPYFGAAAASELSSSLDHPSQLWYQLDNGNKWKMAGCYFQSLHDFLSGISGYLSAGCTPACVKRDAANSTLKAYSKREEFEKEGGWIHYFLTLKNDDQVEFIEWHNKNSANVMV